MSVERTNGIPSVKGKVIQKVWIAFGESGRPARTVLLAGRLLPGFWVNDCVVIHTFQELPILFKKRQLPYRTDCTLLKNHSTEIHFP